MARKIENALVAAIRHNVSFRSGSTNYNAATRTVTLYQTAIAQREGDGWRFNLGGYNTATTRSRLNALASAFGLNPVGTRQGTPYVRREGIRCEVPASDWFYP